MHRTFPAFCLAISFLFSHGNRIAEAEENAQNLESVLAEARAFQARGDFSQAAVAYRKAVALEPSVPELWANLGLMEHEAGKISEAMTTFQHAARLKPSLFVPQLFLGLEYLQSNQAQAALPYLENAVRLNPNDIQAVRSLGKTHALLGHNESATELYLKEVQLAPDRGDSWLDLGITYLQQVENDARLMTSSDRDSAYVNLRTAEVLAEEGKLVDAEEAYKAVIASRQEVPCGFAEYGITLLRRQNLAAAREQFNQEIRTGSHCALAALGLSIAEAASGNQEAALGRLVSIASADPAFVRVNLPLFRGAASTEQVRALINLARSQPGASSLNLDSLVEEALQSDDAPAPPTEFKSGQASEVETSSVETPSSRDARRFYDSGHYTECSQSLEPVFQNLSSLQQQLLAACSFYVGDFQTTSRAAQQLKKSSAARTEGLYWESKADQYLAICALTRAGEIDADSPRMHVLLGDVFREKHRWDEAEAEYRKAVALDSSSRSARLSLAITLFSEMKIDEALSLDKALLSEASEDPEANLLAAEILIQRNRFTEAEPYLLRCADLKLELLPRYHTLLGKVYAETNRVPAAIAEYKLGLAADRDGSVHYQLGRLYRDSGDRAAATEEFEEAKRLADRKNDRERLAVGQSPAADTRPSFEP
jgi:tetratricopeptide (TPR) repeat protein